MPNTFDQTEPIPSGRWAIVVAKYNESITGKLYQGALDAFQQKGIKDEEIDVAWVPGAFELPVVAKQLAASGKYLSVICLGAVIRGETTHDQHINRAVSDALMQLGLEYNLPVLFGVLTCQTLEQAIQRSGGKVGNKGQECADAAIQMACLLQQIASKDE